MVTGVVKWFTSYKGYGFISLEGKKEDIFVHQTNIQMEGFRTLHKGDKVLFDIFRGPKGLEATRVEIIESTWRPSPHPHPHARQIKKTAGVKPHHPINLVLSNNDPSNAGRMAVVLPVEPILRKKLDHARDKTTVIHDEPMKKSMREIPDS